MQRPTRRYRDKQEDKETNKEIQRQTGKYTDKQGDIETNKGIQ